MVDMRREVANIRKSYGWYQRTMGEGVLWFEYDAENSEFTNVFNEGGRTWAKGIGVPALWVIEGEDDEENPPEGGRYQPKLTMALSVHAIRGAGVSDVLDSERHQNDVVLFHRALWSVNRYQIRSAGGVAVVIGCECERLSPDEDMVFDNLPPELEEMAKTYRRERAHDDATDDERPYDDYQIPQWEGYEIPQV